MLLVGRLVTLEPHPYSSGAHAQVGGSHRARGNRKGSRERRLEVTESKDAATGAKRSRTSVVDGAVLKMRVAFSYTALRPEQGSCRIGRVGAIARRRTANASSLG